MLIQRYIFVAIIIVLGLIWGWIGKMSYDSKLLEFEAKSKKTFIEALNIEMRNRNIPNMPMHSNSTTASLLKTEYPDSVYIMDETGKHYFKFYIEFISIIL